MAPTVSLHMVKLTNAGIFSFAKTSGLVSHSSPFWKIILSVKWDKTKYQAKVGKAKYPYVSRVEPSSLRQSHLKQQQLNSVITEFKANSSTLSHALFASIHCSLCIKFLTWSSIFPIVIIWSSLINPLKAELKKDHKTNQKNTNQCCEDKRQRWADW